MMSLNRLLPLAALALLVAVMPAHAQEAVRIAVCNPAKVFDGMEERTAVQSSMKAQRDRLQAEAARRKAELNQLKEQRDALKPDSQQYADMNNRMMTEAVNFEVWARLQQAEMDRKEKEQVKALYDKITEASKEIAEEKKIDLVIAEHTPLIPADMTNITPDQLRQLISANNVLYKNAKADITNDVLLRVNTKYSGPKSNEKKP